MARCDISPRLCEGGVGNEGVPRWACVSSQHAVKGGCSLLFLGGCEWWWTQPKKSKSEQHDMECGYCCGLRRRHSCLLAMTHGTLGLCSTPLLGTSANPTGAKQRFLILWGLRSSRGWEGDRKSTTDVTNKLHDLLEDVKCDGTKKEQSREKDLGKARWGEGEISNGWQRKSSCKDVI